MPDSVAVLKSALAVNVHQLPSLEHATTSAGLSTAAACGGKLALEEQSLHGT
jgi:hypothetical protein